MSGLIVMCALTLLAPHPASAAVGITASTWADGPAGTTVLIHGAVQAAASMPDDCPAAPGDGSNGDSTVCTYVMTAIQRHIANPPTWAAHVAVLGGGPNPAAGNRIEVVMNCNLDGTYRTYFQQVVKDTDNAAAPWTDDRWNTGVAINCSVPIRPTPPSVPQP